MAFWATSFSLDGVPSEYYGLLISQIDSSGVVRTAGSNPMTIYNQKIFRRNTPYFYGATPADVLKFPFSAHAMNELTGVDFELIQKFFFSSRTYRKLQIFQNDLADIYFNVIFNDPQIVRIGNTVVGFDCTVECDSPFGYLPAETTTFNYTNPVIEDNFDYNNISDDSGYYLYPTVQFTINQFGGDFSLTNVTDSNRIFSFTDLSAGEVVTVNNDLQTVSSSTGLKRLSSFNKKFFRLLPGNNSLLVNGNISQLKITSTFIARRMGG